MKNLRQVVKLVRGVGLIVLGVKAVTDAVKKWRR